MNKSKLKPRMGRPPVLENARNRILEEAALLFGKDGFDNGSLSVVAERLGVSKAAVYHYFGSKQEIYDAIIIRTLEGLLIFVGNSVAASKGGEAKLKSFMTAHASYFEENYWSFVCMLIGYGGMANPGLKFEATQKRVEYESILRKIVAEGIADGTFRNVDVTTASHSVLSMLNWMVRWFNPNGPKRAEEFALEYFELLTLGLSSRQ
ncbi:TetR/AcrR family transcriptional regulator [Brucella sp. C7-11G]|nr:TetR family transcriptional regulator [Ochrobactrum sp. MT180101]